MLAVMERITANPIILLWIGVPIDLRHRLTQRCRSRVPMGTVLVFPLPTLGQSAIRNHPTFIGIAIIRKGGKTGLPTNSCAEPQYGSSHGTVPAGPIGFAWLGQKRWHGPK